jgi:hypothetical protein
VSHAAAGGGHRRAVGHDGRSGRGDPGSAGRGRIRSGAHHVVRREVRVRLLRAVPGGGSQHAGLR